VAERRLRVSQVDLSIVGDVDEPPLTIVTFYLHESDHERLDRYTTLLPDETAEVLRGWLSDRPDWEEIVSD